MREPTITHLIPAPAWAAGPAGLEAQWKHNLRIRILGIAVCRTDQGQEVMWLDEAGSLRPLMDLAL
jgi:hypothetical protein